MPRKLKTYITNLGFFELAIAAPSMKAALEAWGMSHNAFQHGFAKQTEDPAIVSTTEAMPGVVLKRVVGTSGAFKVDAALPDKLPNIRPPAITRAKPRVAKPAAGSRTKSKGSQKPKTDPAAIISFEKARRTREAAQAKEEAKLAKERVERNLATERAQRALQDAQQAHEEVMVALDREREKLDRRAEKATDRWEAQRKKLTEAVVRARD